MSAPESSATKAPAAPLPVADLHCDLLAYLALDAARTPLDPAARSSLPQLRAGGVAFQTLAVFTLSEPGSTDFAAREAAAWQRLLDEHGEQVVAVRGGDDLASLGDGDGDGDGDGRVAVVAAIENASAFCEEDEPLDAGLDRFERLAARLGGRLLYVSLTWSQENRFGGGNASDTGLKPDGRALIDFLAARGGTAIDFSHTSPRMAEEVLDHLEARGHAEVSVCASHSCFASEVDIPRNLRDDVARAIAARGGVIGLNFMRPFLGGEEPFAAVRAHLDHALELGLEKAYGFGADFFCTDDVPEHLRASAPHGQFFERMGDASRYPPLLRALAEAGYDPDLLADLAHRNVARFVGTVLGKD